MSFQVAFVHWWWIDFGAHSRVNANKWFRSGSLRRKGQIPTDKARVFLFLILLLLMFVAIGTSRVGGNGKFQLVKAE
jgi:hypothetical protein